MKKYNPGLCRRCGSKRISRYETSDGFKQRWFCNDCRCTFDKSTIRNIKKIRMKLSSDIDQLVIWEKGIFLNKMYHAQGSLCLSTIPTENIANGLKKIAIRQGYKRCPKCYEIPTQKKGLTSERCRTHTFTGVVSEEEGDNNGVVPEEEGGKVNFCTKHLRCYVSEICPDCSKR